MRGDGGTWSEVIIRDPELQNLVDETGSFILSGIRVGFR